MIEHSCNVFIWQDRRSGPLKAPYNGPYWVVEHHDRIAVVDIPGHGNDTVTVDRIKPAVLWHHLGYVHVVILSNLDLQLPTTLRAFKNGVLSHFLRRAPFKSCPAFHLRLVQLLGHRTLFSTSSSATLLPSSWLGGAESVEAQRSFSHPTVHQLSSRNLIPLIEARTYPHPHTLLLGPDIKGEEVREHYSWGSLAMNS